MGNPNSMLIFEFSGGYYRGFILWGFQNTNIVTSAPQPSRSNHPRSASNDPAIGTGEKMFRSGQAWAKKKPRPFGQGFCGIGRRPTLTPAKALPSARPGLTSLFGMGRGVPRRYNHRNLAPALFPRRMGLTVQGKESSPPQSLFFFRVTGKVSGD